MLGILGSPPVSAAVGMIMKSIKSYIGYTTTYLVGEPSLAPSPLPPNETTVWRSRYVSECWSLHKKDPGSILKEFGATWTQVGPNYGICHASASEEDVADVKV